MTASVKLSLKVAEELMRFVEKHVESEFKRPYAASELEGAIRRVKRVSSTRRTLGKPKRAKKAAKRDETAAIRAAVFSRAGGQCELCWCRVPSDLHHAFGRREPQSVANTLALCRVCHDDLTRNVPTSAYWLTLQARHFERFGYDECALKMRGRLAFVEARSALSGGGT